MPKLSAGAVKYGFWFAEFIQLMEWVTDSEDDQTIRQRVIDTNAFEQRSVARTENVVNCILRRIRSLPEDLREIFPSLDLDNQRITVLIGIMNTDELIRRFMLDCFKDAVVLGDEVLQDYELNAFFSRLQAERDEVAEWHDNTIQRLKGTIRNYLRASGIARAAGSELALQRPLLDTRLVTILQANHQAVYVVALTGRTNG
ncbi:DUF1819 family protein [Lacticaseibacillus absianus]|uniref:DUF1819 family protein n=1 Tax=Lacticaseibacillus absianus TaxID=2729623 RepID=UPI0015C7A468|nr:DUF1819 family protein [Lacticaseibacillus absianus]